MQRQVGRCRCGVCRWEYISVGCKIVITILGGSSPEEDLALLSSCNHTVVGYGSFGLWGAVLAGGEVVIPQSIQLFRGTASETAARILGWTLLPGF